MTSWLRRSDDEPLFWLGGRAIYVTGLLILIYVTAFVLSALLTASGRGLLVEPFIFHSTEVLGLGKVWQILTYPLVNSLSIWFLIDMIMLYWFGREVEGALGRKGFTFLYLGLVICPALLLTALSPLHPSIYAGSSTLHFALFIAFAAMFPTAELAFGFQAQWTALVLLAFYTLLDLAGNQWSQLLMLWAGSAVAAFAVRAPFLSSFVDWMENFRDNRIAAQTQKRAAIKRLLEQESEQTMDAILDKISRQGLPSLTQKERATLERMRLELIKKEKR